MPEAKEITIAGQTFSVLQPYEAGHTITDAEAKALNQVRAENIRNNMATRVKTAYGDSPTDELNPDTIAAIVAEYDAGYEFTLASVGGGRKPVDPVEVESLRIARSVFTAACRTKGLTVKTVREKLGDDAVDGKIAEIAARADITKEAKRRVDARAKTATDALGDFDLDEVA